MFAFATHSLSFCPDQSECPPFTFSFCVLLDVYSLQWVHSTYWLDFFSVLTTNSPVLALSYDPELHLFLAMARPGQSWYLALPAVASCLYGNGAL